MSADPQAGVAPPARIFTLGLVTVLEPPVLIASWFADRELAGGTCSPTRR